MLLIDGIADKDIIGVTGTDGSEGITLGANVPKASGYAWTKADCATNLVSKGIFCPNTS